MERADPRRFLSKRDFHLIPLLCQIFHLGDRLRLDGGGELHTATQSSKLCEAQPRAPHLAFILLLSADVHNALSF